MLGGQRARGMGGCPVWEGRGAFPAPGQADCLPRTYKVRLGEGYCESNILFGAGDWGARSPFPVGRTRWGGGQQWTLHEQMQKPDQRSTAWAVREIAPMHPHPFVSVPGMQEPVVFSCWGQTGMSVQADGQLMGLEMGAEQRSAGTGYTSGCRVGNQPPDGSA